MSEKRPKVNAEGQKELEKVESQIDNFKESIYEAKERSRTLSIQETEPQTKIAQSDLNKSGILYLKPKRTFPSREKFNEKYRDEFKYQSEYVDFIAENNEVKGESIDFCIKKFPGMPVEEWIVPVNKPVAAPRYVKERIEDCGYTVFVTTDAPVGSEGGVMYYGQMVAEQRKSRLSVREVSKKPKIFSSSRLIA
jgi:hypothetical protein